MVYAVDVDGVIVDSGTQIIADAFNAYRNFYKGTKLFDNQKITLDNYEQILKEYRKTNKIFRELTDFAKAAEENVFLFYLIERRINITTDEEFRKRLNDIDRATLKRWHEEFYRQRYIFQKQKNWQRIIKPYPEMIDLIRRSKSNVVILSNKDCKTIKIMLESYGVRIGKERIFSKEITTDKNEKLKLIPKRFKTEFKDIAFIDDNFVNLKDAKKLGIRCFMATWGYNNEEQRREAEKIGIQLLSLDDLKEFQ